MAATRKKTKAQRPDRNVSTLQFQHNNVNYTVRLGSAGFMGYVSYICKAENGAEVAHGGISRLNYDTQRQHLNAIRKRCLDAAKKSGLDEWDMVRHPSLTDAENRRIRLARRAGYAMFFPAPLAEESMLANERHTQTASQDQRTLQGADEFLRGVSAGVKNLNEKIAEALAKGGEGVIERQPVRLRLRDSLGNVSYLQRKRNGEFNLISSNETPLALSNICPKDAATFAHELSVCATAADALRVTRLRIWQSMTVEEAEEKSEPPRAEAKRKFLVVRYDVTDLNEREAAALMGEALAQGEASDEHPDVVTIASEEE